MRRTKEEYTLRDEYYNIIRSNLVSHHNKLITPELIELIIKQIIESFEHFINN